MLPIVFAIIAVLAPASSPSPASVLASVQKYYGGATQLTTKFEQTVVNPAYGTTQKSSGKVYLVSPDKMRWDYDAKKQGGAKKSFIFDGKTLWAVEPKNLQVFKSSASGSMLPAALSFASGTAQLTKEFDVKLAPNSPYGATVLELSPKQPSAQYKRLYFVVASDGHVEKSIVIDANDNSNEITFEAHDLTTKLESRLFQFDPKSVPTFKVIDVDAKKP
jgi:outer membrane lipoprotein-sorting protein